MLLAVLWYDTRFQLTGVTELQLQVILNVVALSPQNGRFGHGSQLNKPVSAIELFCL